MSSTNQKITLLVLLGPTAVGKTSLSLHLAERWQAEIISGDSMQVYRGLDVGTAKATADERGRIPHHMIDICDPDVPYSVSRFQESTQTAIHDIAARGKLPFLVGGTGLYIESVCYDYRFGHVGSDPLFRSEQESYAREHGQEALLAKLAEVDSESAARLHPNDERRIIRALEVHHLTGVTASERLAEQHKESPYNLVLLGLTMDRAMLYKRIEERVDLMIAQGFIEEVRHLLNMGYSPSLPAMQALGYKEMVRYVQEEVSLEETIRLIKMNTRRFAKRQLSWFRHMKDIVWIDLDEHANFTPHLDTINDIIAGKCLLR